ncbi:MAG: M1 family metallopeptidase [Flavobacteriales bacterium]|nr:M1 family metallopeptidase [Flavobacteriales bacterium]
MKKIFLITIYLFINFHFLAQNSYWQQEIKYDIEVDFDHKMHQFNLSQEITYSNNSPDDLEKVFFHLYYNAFQPGSMMDVRSRTIKDPDSRVGERIYRLKPSEIGFQKIISLKNEKEHDLKFNEQGTILEVFLEKPLRPGKKIKLSMLCHSQVPVQIRRTGRYNKENVAYSMTQWYPKMCEYDLEGWHSNPYIGREFYGVWGEFNVTINIDSSFNLGGTGIIQNPNEVGFGYENEKFRTKKYFNNKLKWKFNAKNVHDFAWAADPFFIHEKSKLSNGTVLHFLHKDDSLNENWKLLQPYAVKCFEFMNKNYGVYPYKQYSIIQGGDGGMEYPMCTLITAEGSFRGLVSVTVHESIHSWFQGLLGTNESKYEWMDEGFCTYAQYEVLNYLYGKKQLNPLARQYKSYNRLANSNFQEPLTTHADFYNLNYVYGVNAYNKGSIFLNQLGYVIGTQNLKSGMKKYFDQWKFKHPKPVDFKKIMEQESSLELDWYFEQFITTINKIDYSIYSVESNEGKTKIIIEKIGRIPMPLDISITNIDSTVSWFNIPLRIMRGAKGVDMIGDNVTIKSDWPWVYNFYEFEVDVPKEEILKIEIDASTRLADVFRENNIWMKDSLVKKTPEIIYRSKL